VPRKVALYQIELMIIRLLCSFRCQIRIRGARGGQSLSEVSTWLEIWDPGLKTEGRGS